MSFRVREAEPADHLLLVDIWLRSVRATHTFLTEADIQSLLPVVRDTALANLELWVLCAADSEPAGFMGIERHPSKRHNATDEHVHEPSHFD